MSTAMSPGAASFSWLLERFVADTPGVTDTVAVSSDGLLLAAAGTTATEDMERFGAIVSGLNGLTRGAADCFAFDDVVQVIVEMEGGYLFVARIGDGSVLGVLAARGCDVGLIGYEMTMLVERAGKVLTPELIVELQNLLVA